MNRIVYMVLRHLPIVPYWFWKIDHMGKRPDQYPEQERYDYLRNIIKTINQNGRVTVRGYGEEQLPKETALSCFRITRDFLICWQLLIPVQSLWV